MEPDNLVDIYKELLAAHQMLDTLCVTSQSPFVMDSGECKFCTYNGFMGMHERSCVVSTLGDIINKLHRCRGVL